MAKEYDNYNKPEQYEIRQMDQIYKISPETEYDVLLKDRYINFPIIDPDMTYHTLEEIGAWVIQESKDPTDTSEPQ